MREIDVLRHAQPSTRCISRCYRADLAGKKRPFNKLRRKINSPRPPATSPQHRVSRDGDLVCIIDAEIWNIFDCASGIVAARGRGSSRYLTSGEPERRGKLIRRSSINISVGRAEDTLVIRPKIDARSRAFITVPLVTARRTNIVRGSDSLYFALLFFSETGVISRRV